MNLASQVLGGTHATAALIEGTRRVGRDELADLVHRARSGLRSRGVVPGARVVLVAPTGTEFVVTALAVLAEGGVVVPLNPLAPAAELRAELEVVEPALVVAAADLLGTLTAARPQATIDVVCPSDLGSADGTVPHEPVIARAASDAAVVLFTSGTAGAPRGAVLTHGSLLANLEQVDAHDVDLVGPGDVVYGVLPMFHVLGFNVVLGAALRSGATVVLVDRFEPQQALDDIARLAVTTVVGPPTLWAALADAPTGHGPADVSSVRLALAGAAPLEPAVATRVRERFGLELRQGYGLTEMSPVVSLAGPLCPVSTVGTPLPGVEVRLVDEDGHDVLVDDVGEIWVRGPNMFAGYLGDPEGTAAVMAPGGWLRTGDLGVVDRAGRLTVVGRIKDLVVVSGFNVHPPEVEAVLASHPAVDAAAVVGEPDPRTGERVVAHVVLVPGAEVADDELAAHVSARLAAYKCPAAYVRCTDLPRGVAGKLRRRELRPAPEGST